jgi:two-component system CheB/CheR fusion protein
MLSDPGDPSSPPDTGLVPCPPASAAPAEPALAELYVVGIGASAGGLEPLEQFFQSMPVDSGMAFIVQQHLSPDFESRMDELLARQTSIPIRRVVDGMPIEPDSIYLVPPKSDMMVYGGRLLLTDKDPDRGFSLPIDRLFRSLAQDLGPRAMGVILSGTGSDGSRGARDIRNAGGFVIGQTEESAAFDGMPRSAREAGATDMSLAPHAIPEALIQHVAAREAQRREGGEPSGAAPDRGFARIFRLLKSEHGIDFAHYKPSTVQRRVERRLAMTNESDVERYAEQLASDPAELNALYCDLLIGVTRFFRDPEAFRHLERDVIPAILERTERDRDLRVWVCGCATGEEAYSVAMLFHEQLEAAGRPLNIKIFATDVHAASLETASAGRYPVEALADMPEARRNRYFTFHGDRVQVTNELRSLLVFARHNAMSDAPFTRLDLVTCRNLLIYLQPEAQNKALSLFHFGLRQSGYLFLGPSETPADLSDEFDGIDKQWRIYRKRRDVKLPAELRLPLTTRALTSRRSTPSSQRWSKGLPDAQLLTTYDSLLGRFMPPSLLVDENYDLLHAFAGAERFARLRSGRPSTNILDLVDDDLRTSLSGALSQAERAQQPVRYSGVRLRTESGEELHRMVVEPFHDARSSRTHFLVRLEPLGSPAALPESADSEIDLRKLSRDYIASLEDELRFTKENLQATIEELETSNEELQATNEELVAANEELQSTNEELHSVNEELYTVNGEHQRKIVELTEMTDDLDNLLHSTDIGVVFLDEQLCIRKFTAKMAKMLRLLPQDVGRHFESFSHGLEHPRLFEDIQQVMTTQKPVEREVQTRRGAFYFLRILPYLRDQEGGGVVLTLIDVGTLKRSEANVRRLSAIVESSTDAILGKNLDGIITAWNRGAQQLYGYTAEEAIGQHVRLIAPKDRERELEDILERVKSGESVPAFETVRKRRDGTLVDVSLVVSPIRDEFDLIVGASAIARDVTQRKRSEEQVRRTVRQRDQFLAMLSHELRNPLAAMLNAARVLEEEDIEENIKLQSCTVMQRQARHMARLLDDLLDVSRMRQDKIEMRKEVIDLRNTVQNVLDAVSPTMRDAGVQLEVHVDDGPLVIHADPTRIIQLQVNLLVNAAKYTPSGRRVRFSITREGEHAVVRVKDEGLGISTDMLEEIFEPFVQCGHTADRANQGMGLGLALVRSITKAHGGVVSANSPGIDRGSEFVVRLPLRPEVVQATDRPRPAAPRPATRKRVVVIEDVDDSRELIQIMLERKGFEVFTYGTGTEGLEGIRSTRPDVAVVDIGLPDISGYEVASTVRAEQDGHRPYLIALTGYGQQNDRERVFQAGFDRHLVKPLEMDVLIRLLAAAPGEEALAED